MPGTLACRLVTRDALVAYCLAKPGAWLDQPWEDDEVVKVADKIFVFLGSGGAGPPSIGVKCGRSAEEARELQERYPSAVSKLAYIGRYGWNSVRLDGTLPDAEVHELVDASYDTVVAALPRSRRPS